MRSFRDRLSELAACVKNQPDQTPSQDRFQINVSPSLSVQCDEFNSIHPFQLHSKEREPGINKLLPGPASGVDPEDDDVHDDAIPLGNDTDLGMAAKAVSRWVNRQGSFSDAAIAAEVSLEDISLSSPTRCVSFWTLRDATARLPIALVCIRQVLLDPSLTASQCGEMILADASGCTIRASIHPQLYEDDSTRRAMVKGGSLVLREVRPLQLSAASELLLLITTRSLVAVFEPSGVLGGQKLKNETELSRNTLLSQKNMIKEEIIDRTGLTLNSQNPSFDLDTPLQAVEDSSSRFPMKRKPTPLITSNSHLSSPAPPKNPSHNSDQSSSPCCDSALPREENQTEEWSFFFPPTSKTQTENKPTKIPRFISNPQPHQNDHHTTLNPKNRSPPLSSQQIPTENIPNPSQTSPKISKNIQWQTNDHVENSFKNASTKPSVIPHETQLRTENVARPQKALEKNNLAISPQENDDDFFF
eukprot:GDKJ01013479.1.p1 GENE.GDKJ01013479.1~~GDKJ01013479.1.p1  ORF type:complete len:474 (-),score=74.75 GDKJ01013479.1:586-2007(-)